MSKLHSLTPVLNKETAGQTVMKGNWRPFDKGKWKPKRGWHRNKTTERWKKTDEWRNRRLAMQGHSPKLEGRVEGLWVSEAQRSALERRSVVSGSCWIVWCSIRASNPALLVMAVRTLRSCSNSSSSLYHTRTRSRSTSARRSFSQQ